MKINGSNKLPSKTAVDANATVLAEYARICQNNGLVPIVEPEILRDGNYGLDTAVEVANKVLVEVFDKLEKYGVYLEGIILKPNMVLPGIDAARSNSVEEVAKATYEVLQESVPAQVPGIAFLSGGQSEVLATVNLNAINQEALKDVNHKKWKLTFSYGRALQQSVF